MYVPNYIPEPIEVPSSISTERYLLRIKFIRRVATLHSVGLGIVGLLSMLPISGFGLVYPLVALVLALIGLDILRIQRRGMTIEARLSSYALPFVLTLCGGTIHELNSLGIPMWSVFMGPAFMLVYTILSGRDFSFVGGGFISWIASSVMVAYLAGTHGLDSKTAAYALAINLCYLTYYVYDLAALMQRRRRGEELAAVVDLYRDVFNLFGYVPRVIHHWRKYRIWNIR